uniref:Uncharacterized protein n=1 Tax=Strongyloides venezuelensis TaxID=75913 RepID=A0A0K0G5G4_STRVS
MIKNVLRKLIKINNTIFVFCKEVDNLREVLALMVKWYNSRLPRGSPGIVVSTPRCGRGDVGSIPAIGISFVENNRGRLLHVSQWMHASWFLSPKPNILPNKETCWNMRARSEV